MYLSFDRVIRYGYKNAKSSYLQIFHRKCKTVYDSLPRTGISIKKREHRIGKMSKGKDSINKLKKDRD